MTDDAGRIDGYSGYERATARFTEQLGEEVNEAWREHAPSEAHPNAENAR